MERKRIRVAAAVIHQGDRMLATQRGYGPWKGGWEFPGGKIEPGETPQQALIREIREELKAEIRILGEAGQVEYDYPDFHLSMACFHAELKGGTLQLVEHEAARWVRPEEFSQLDWLPADRMLIRQMTEGERVGE